MCLASPTTCHKCASLAAKRPLAPAQDRLGTPIGVVATASGASAADKLARRCSALAAAGPPPSQGKAKGPHGPAVMRHARRYAAPKTGLIVLHTHPRSDRHPPFGFRRTGVGHRSIVLLAAQVRARIVAGRTAG